MGVLGQDGVLCVELEGCEGRPFKDANRDLRKGVVCEGMRGCVELEGV